MPSRARAKAEHRNKLLRLKAQGKLNSHQIAADRGKDTPMAGDLIRGTVYKVGPDYHTVLPYATEDTAKEMWARRRERLSKDTFSYRNRAGNRLFRNTKTGAPFVVRDSLDEYFASVFQATEYTDAEIMKLGQPNDQGWRDTEPYPLGQTKARLIELMETPEKWQHFNVVNASTRIDLFFSPKKDKWMYVELNPHTALCRVSQILTSKALAEFKRKHSLLRWRTVNPGSLPVIPI